MADIAAKASLLASNRANNNDDEELPTEAPTNGTPVKMKMRTEALSPIPKPAVRDNAGVRNIVSRFEKKQEQSLDALPFRTVRSFFGGDKRSIHVNAEKQKYDALMEKQRQEALLLRSPELNAGRKRVGSNASAGGDGGRLSVEGNNAEEEEEDVVEAASISGEEEVKKTEETIAESNQEEEEEEETAQDPLPGPDASFEIPELDTSIVEEDLEDTPPPPPPALEAEEQEPEKDRSQLVETPEQETKKRPILTTERSFVMEEDHTIETEDMIVVGERFSTDGEEDREEIMALLERELRLTPDDEKELRDALESNPSPSVRGRVLIPKHKYKKPENVPSKLHVPTAASLAGRTTKSPAAAKKDPPAKATPKATTAVTPTRKKVDPYANVQSKVKQMINTPSQASMRKESDASDAGSHSMKSPESTKSSASSKARLSAGAASVDRRSFMSNKSSRRSSNFRTLGDLHGEDAHSDWEGRHRNERLSFASSTSSTDSSDPFALQLSYSARKSRYDSVEPRYLDYSKSSTYTRNKEAQLERRKKLEEANSLKSAERQKQINFQQSQKAKREKEDLENAVRRGEELHKFTELVREKEKREETERRLSMSATRRALSGTGLEPRRRPSMSSAGASSPRTSVISESDSLPSAASAPSVEAFAV